MLFRSYILKLDNDVETVTEDMIARLVDFIEKAGPHAVSPPDLMIDPKFYPTVFKRAEIAYRPRGLPLHGCRFLRLSRRCPLL